MTNQEKIQKLQDQLQALIAKKKVTLNLQKLNWEIEFVKHQIKCLKAKEA